MARPVKTRPGRSLAAVALAIIALYLGVFLGPSATPALGLDLRGGTQVTLTAHAISGGGISKSALNQAVNIIRQRANGIGANGAEVSTQGGTNIVVSVPGKGHDAVVKQIGQTALLRFRQALSIESGTPTPTTTTSPSPSVSSKPHGKGAKTSSTSSPSATKSSSSKKHNQGAPLTKALLKPAATPTKSPKAHSSSPPTPTATPTATTSPSPNPTSTAADTTNVKPLPGSESPTLTPAFEKSFANWDCSKHPNPTQGADRSDYYIIACSTDKATKYLLDKTAVEGTQVSSATAGLDNQSGTQWVVDITIKGSGVSAYQAVTKKAYQAGNGQPSTSCSPPTGCNAVAIVLDGVVESAPYTSSDSPNGIPGGRSEISGSFTQSSADDLANVLKYGALPLKFTQSDVQSVSATLGNQQLRGGLIAGAIGLGLVIVFSLLYYRALGLVTVGSLAVSGLILYSVTTLLGHSSVGYTLSLPGIAGFIVAIGITADSFVVFFERIRDEIREGKRLRSAVDRGWPRARRTIISADFVSLLAAFVLYVVSIGDVRGFAFTLGMSTLSDLFIVFFFTKPLLEVMGKWRAFDSGKAWTGIGKARAGIVQDVAADYVRRSQRTEV